MNQLFGEILNRVPFLNSGNNDEIEIIALLCIFAKFSRVSKDTLIEDGVRKQSKVILLIEYIEKIKKSTKEK